jgi:hypothetical protein
MAGAFPISGPIDPQAFPFLLVDLHHSGATGSLKVEGPSYQKALYFRGGRILFGSSNDPRDQLGAILIETGTLTPEQLEDANSKVGPGSPLAKVLSETGFVSQRELGEAARAKVERILSDVVAYTAGSFEFEDGVLPKGAVDLKLSTEKVLLAAVRRVTDRGFVLRHLEGLDVVLTPVPEMKGKLPEVEAEAAELLSRLDGKTTLKNAAAGTKLDEFDAAKLACTLVFLGLLRRTDERPSLAAAPAPFVRPPQAFGPEIDLSDTAREALIQPRPAVPAFPATPAPAAPAPVTFEPAQPFSFEAAPEPPAPVLRTAEPEMSIFVPDDVKPVGPPPAPAPVPAAAPAFTLDAEPAPIFVPDAEPPSPAPAAPAPAFTASAPVLPLIPPPAPPSAAAARDTAPYIPSRTPDLSIPPAPAGVGPSKREAREWKPPARSGATPPPARPTLPPDLDAEPVRPAASRPSKDDLAALDALLNSKGVEGPLPPLERPSPERWSPHFGARGAPGGARPMPSGSGRTKAAVVALALAGAATAALWYYFVRPQPGASASSTRPVAAASPRPAPADAGATGTASEAGDAPVASPSAPAAIRAETPPAPRATPLRTPAPAPATPRPSASPTPRAAAASGEGGLREARARLAAGELPAAARSFASHVRAAPRGSASVQLLVACSAETVQKAVANVSSPELFIVPVRFQGRDCYRLCWGLYPSGAEAATAVRALPEYFRKGGATPRVMSAAELLP